MSNRCTICTRITFQLDDASIPCWNDALAWMSIIVHTHFGVKNYQSPFPFYDFTSAMPERAAISLRSQNQMSIAFGGKLFIVSRTALTTEHPWYMLHFQYLVLI